MIGSMRPPVIGEAIKINLIIVGQSLLTPIENCHSLARFGHIGSQAISAYLFITSYK